ncbi:MAG: hypothetical protein GY725_07475 [bacterium]|nr:hypothetical protein [bacterium]
MEYKGFLPTMGAAPIEKANRFGTVYFRSNWAFSLVILEFQPLGDLAGIQSSPPLMCALPSAIAEFPVSVFVRPAMECSIPSVFQVDNDFAELSVVEHDRHPKRAWRLSATSRSAVTPLWYVDCSTGDPAAHEITAGLLGLSKGEEGE